MDAAGSRPRLAGYDLHHVLGRGGMAEVWHGVQQRGHLPVAIKFITAASEPHGAWREALSAEVRAVAALSHPHIVCVVDHGTLEESTGPLRAGVPWLAMELCSGGTLRARLGRTDWGEIRQILAALLRALAHAHARGLVHLDVKPDNVLLALPGDLRPGVKLSDFGLAAALEPLRSPGGAAGRLASRQWESPTPLLERTDIRGTPNYMAPEQIEGRWRDFGPWTDLYALGCLAWELVTCRPPFVREQPSETLRAHLKGSPGGLLPWLPVPVGLEGWLRRLVARRPEERFERAADALAQLERLGAPPSPAGGVLRPPPATSAGSETPTLTAAHAPGGIPALGGSGEPTVPVGSPAMGGPPPAEDPPGGHPPLSAAWVSWREVEAPLPDLAPEGSLSLFALRALPLIGRDAERDQLWASLGEVLTTRRAHLHVITGPSGTGKSRLAEWLGQRAHELGLATVLRVLHGPDGGPSDGLGSMVARALRCQGLPRADVKRRLETYNTLGASPREVESLTELICPTPIDPTLPSGLLLAQSPAERSSALLHLFRGLAERRPVVLLVDDVQWGAETLAFLQHMVEVRDWQSCPLLAVLTVQEEALAERPQTRKQLEGLLKMPGVASTPLPPMGTHELRALVGAGLGLEPGLREEVVERTRGNPLFAIQLVGDWVERGWLQPGEGGLRRAQGVEPTLPDDLHQIWDARLTRLLRGRDPSWRTHLELAATLGLVVAEVEWEGLCAQVGGGPGIELLDLLCAARLMKVEGRAGQRSWSFVHGMLRESIERLARAAGRTGLHHRRCAQMLAALEPLLSRSVRQAGHLLHAGEPAQAISLLLPVIEEHLLRAELDEAHALLTRCEQALKALAADEGEPLRWWVVQLRADHVSQYGDYDQGSELSQQVLQWSRAHAHGPLEARSLLRLALVRMRQGSYEQAGPLADLAAPRLGEHGMIGWQAACVHFQGELAKMRGDLATSERLSELALDLAQRSGVEFIVLLCLARSHSMLLLKRDLDGAERLCQRMEELLTERLTERGRAFLQLLWAQVAEARGDPARSERGARDAIEHCQHTTDRLLESLCWNHLGESLRKQGRLGEAADAFRESSRRSLERDGSRVWVARHNLLLCLFGQGQLDQGVALLGEHRRYWSGSADVHYTFSLRTLEGFVGAHHQDWRGASEALGQLGALAPRLLEVDADDVFCLSLVRLWAQRDGEGALARTLSEVLERLRARLTTEQLTSVARRWPAWRGVITV